MRLDDVELALEARAHRAARAVEQCACIVEPTLAQLHEFTHARREDALHRRAVGALDGVGVQVVDVLAGPEITLEIFVGRAQMTIAQQAWRRSPQRDTLLAEGTIRIGCVDAGTFRPQRIPNAIVETLSPSLTGTSLP